MRKAKFVWKDIINNNKSGRFDLTLGKIYDVIKYTKSKHFGSNTIKIKCDDGIKRTYFLHSSEEIYFIDATIELRNEVIDGILL